MSDPTTDSLGSKEYMEKIRLSYKKEALQAVEIAEKRILEKANDVIKTKDDEIKKWKGIAEAISLDENINDKQCSNLLKYIMEQVYRDCKKEFPTDNDSKLLSSLDIINKMKSVLISSTDTLSNKLPAGTISFNIKESMPKKNILQQEYNMLQEKYIKLEQKFKKQELLLHKQEDKIQYYKENLDHNIESNEFISNNKQLISYNRPEQLQCRNNSLPMKIFVRIKIPDITVNSKIRKRDIIFNSLGSSITYYCIESEIFVLKGNSNSIDQIGIPVSINQNRRYSEFESLYNTLSKEFIYSIIPSLPSISSTVDENDSLSSRRRRQLSIWLQYILLHGTLQNSLDLSKFITSTSLYDWNKKEISDKKNIIKSNSKNTIKSMDLTFETHQKNIFVDELINRSNLNTKKLKNSIKYGIENHFALQELNIVSKDFSFLEINFKYLAKSCKNFIKCIVDVSNTYKVAVFDFKSMSRIEAQDEKKIWSLLSVSFSNIHPSMLSNAMIWHNNIYEHISFFNKNFIPAATLILDNANSIITSNNTDDFEKVDISNKLGSEWKTNRNIRSCIMIEQLQSTAIEMVNYHHNLVDLWEKAAMDLMLLFPNMENDNIEGVENIILNKSNDNNNNFNSLFVKTSSILNSDKMIQQRPIIPTGTRKEPTKKKIIFNDAIQYDEYKNPNNKVVPPKSQGYTKSSLKNTQSSATVPHPKSSSISNSHSNNNLATNDSFPVASSYTINNSTNEVIDNSRQQTQTTPITPTKKSGWSIGKLNPFKSKDKEPDINSWMDNNSTTNRDSFGNNEDDNEDDNEDEEDYPEYIEDPDDTPMNKKLKFKAYEAEKARYLGEKRQNEMFYESGGIVDELADRRNRSRRTKLQQSSEKGIQHRRTKVKTSIPGVEGGVFISEIKPASSSMTGEYKGFKCNTNDSNYPNISSKSPINFPEETKPLRNRSKTETDIFSNSSLFMQSSSPFMQSNSSRARTQSNNMDTSKPSKNDETSNKSVSCNDLPVGWEEVKTDTGSYYYHKVTRISRWDKPDSNLAAAHEARLDQSKKQVDEAVLRRKEEMDHDKKYNEDRLLAADQLKAKVKKKIDKWRLMYGATDKMKHIGVLISTLHTILDFVNEKSLPTNLTSLSTSSEIKRAYFQTLRIVHPDKISSTIDLEQQMIATEVFVIISELYKAY